ncbi:MAG: GNAT family N-acetyltransferase [Candidatus Kariarchaeaceae archaeon]|jgi:GNAT superfamily N-acetyltransferase
MATIEYKSDVDLTKEQFIQILKTSTLSERRPVDDLDRIDKMLKHADLTITAWDGELLVGVSRSITDFSFCAYLSDLAVHTKYQGHGIGKQLIEETRNKIGKDVMLFLFSAPKADSYYPHVGFQKKEAWIIMPE